ncbi:DUF4097 family beta strand repeat-containing protein [Nonomuraea sp. NPDC050790]|uniref:DUF4097 family beta strand repeat-containing protein n=1 Tax=Nonomuraea sp. NPDC050790 TaxID=3364371 RepID=UPI00378CBD9E
MPTFDTPEPITVRIDLPGGEVKIIAGERADTVVDIRPGDEEEEETGAIQAVYQAGTLTVTAPPRRDGLHDGLHSGLDRAVRQAVGGRQGGWSLSGLVRMLSDWGHSSPAVTIEVPAGSHVQGEASGGDFRCVGRLGECRLRSDYGDIRLDEADTVRLRTGSGDITVDRVGGRAEITTDSGEVRVHEIGGGAAVSNDDGECYLGEVGGDLRLSGVHGDMRVERAHAGVEAKTVYGSVRIGQVTRGLVELTSTGGDLEVGIREGTAALLEVSTAQGRLVNALEPREGPGGFEETVEIRARSHDGDITIRRA